MWERPTQTKPRYLSVIDEKATPVSQTKDTLLQRNESEITRNPVHKHLHLWSSPYSSSALRCRASHQDWMSAAKTRPVPCSGTCSGTCHHPIEQATLSTPLILNGSHSSLWLHTQKTMLTSPLISIPFQPSPLGSQNHISNLTENTSLWWLKNTNSCILSGASKGVHC